MKVGEQAIYLARLKGLSRKEAVERLKYWFKKFTHKVFEQGYCCFNDW
jgi:ABC-type uncharacterized transport system ATPase subunit